MGDGYRFIDRKNAQVEEKERWQRPKQGDILK